MLTTLIWRIITSWFLVPMMNVFCDLWNKLKIKYLMFLFLSIYYEAMLMDCILYTIFWTVFVVSEKMQSDLYLIHEKM